jgi:hypothetical protein
MSRFYTQQATIKRLTTTVSSGRTVETWQNIDIMYCLVQPASLELITVGAGSFFDTFNIYSSDDVDVVVGDRLDIASEIYQVQGIQARSYGDRANHKKISAIKS